MEVEGEARMALTALSLFSGAGGMDIGLERAGFEHLGLIEIGARQRESIRANRDWSLLGDGDVNELASSLRPSDLGIQRGQLDLIAGGPPCQPFSMAAQWAANGRKGMLDRRALTVPSTLSLVSKFLPRAVLFENVRGFVAGPQSALKFLEDEFIRIGHESGVTYKLHVSVLNAADFGVPQNRNRAIVVAIREGSYAWPDATHVDAPVTAWDALWDVRPDELPQLRGKWGDLLPLIPEGNNYLWLTSRGGGPEIFGYRTKFWNFLLKLSKSAPAWTLSASPGPSTGPFHWDNRPLATEEQLRLQTFPDDWVIRGNYRERTLQIGNATPPLLAEVLGVSIRSALTGEPQIGPTLLRSGAAVQSPIAAPVSALPQKYSALVGKKPAHKGEGLGPAGRIAAES